ncbi:MAG TPA: DUF2460 domain-containing protein [Candidatus Tectomicrobia bacterium]|nr:DUF2460 domain-containing protein [Candidatus Tectomicrobia bacterium]
MFSEQQLPLKIALRSSGGPSWSVSIVRVDSGFEQRNTPWAQDLGTWDVGSFVTTHAEMATLLDFFHSVRGRLIGFRFPDPKDRLARDQLLGTGDGVRTTYQLVKTYGSGSGAYTRTIHKPVAGTSRVVVNGVLQVEGTAYTLDTTTGLVTFLVGHIPAAGQAVTWTGEFDKPARFDVNQLDVSYDDLEYGRVTVPIVEVRLP